MPSTGLQLPTFCEMGSSHTEMEPAAQMYTDSTEETDLWKHTDKTEGKHHELTGSLITPKNHPTCLEALVGAHRAGIYDWVNAAMCFLGHQRRHMLFRPTEWRKKPRELDSLPTAQGSSWSQLSTTPPALREQEQWLLLTVWGRSDRQHHHGNSWDNN